MTQNILLYGATGFSGGMIAARAGEVMGDFNIVLGGRNGAALRKVADRFGMAFRAFSLDDPGVIDRNLAGIDLIINAAGPFAETAEKLAPAALRRPCHYVDINGELNVYRKLDDRAGAASQTGISLVCGAAASAGASDVMLEVALKALVAAGSLTDGGLGAVRIAMAQVPDFSRGSAATALTLLREEVLVVRKGKTDDGQGGRRVGMVNWHEKVGRLERSFDFSDDPKPKPPGRAGQGLRIASAANLIDTPTARHTVERNRLLARSIESYVETGNLGRFTYQAASMLSPWLALPGVRRLIDAQAALLPEGPSGADLNSKHVSLLEIEDPVRTILWRATLVTPNVYRFTAQIVLEVARAILRGPRRPGWITPAGALDLQSIDVDERGAFAGCAYWTAT